MKMKSMKPPVGKEETYNVGNPRGCVEPGGEVFFFYVGIHRRNILVAFRQMTADAEFVRSARLLDLDRYEKRRAEDRAAQDVFDLL